MLPSGPAGGGKRKSGTYPRSWRSTIARVSASPSSRPLSVRSHGTCSAACDESRRAISECVSSQIGEIAKRVRARSSTEKTNRTTAPQTLCARRPQDITSSTVPSGSAK